MHLWITEASSFIFMLFLLLYPFPIPVPVPISAPISDSGFLVFQTQHVTLSLTQLDESLMSLIENKRSIILYLLSCLWGTSSYDFGFRLVSAEKRTPGGGKTRGLVPRSDVLTSRFMRSFLARIFFFYLPPQEAQKRLRIKKAICVDRSDSIISLTIKRSHILKK